MRGKKGLTSGIFRFFRPGETRAQVFLRKDPTHLLLPAASCVTGIPGYTVFSVSVTTASMVVFVPVSEVVVAWTSSSPFGGFSKWESELSLLTGLVEFVGDIERLW
jgi:hypothetical protein